LLDVLLVGAVGRGKLLGGRDPDKRARYFSSRSLHVPPLWFLSGFAAQSATSTQNQELGITIAYLDIFVNILTRNDFSGRIR